MSTQDPYQHGRQQHEQPSFGALPPQQPYGMQPYQQPLAVVAAKNPAIALLASFFIPGLGSMMNGEVGKGVGILVGYVIGIFLSVFLVGIPLALGMWIWGMIDGYQGAQAWNARHGIIS